MQIVFAVSAAAVFVPVLYHRTTAEETDSLNKDAPGKPLPDHTNINDNFEVFRVIHRQSTTCNSSGS